MTLELLPNDTEQAVLGGFLLLEHQSFDAMTAWATVKVLGLHWRHFGDERHQLIFAAMTLLHRRGDPIDPVTLANELANRQALTRAGGSEYVGELLYVVPHAKNVEVHIRLVREAARVRGGDPNVLPEQQQRDQVLAAIARINLGPEAYRRYPWPSLDRVMGGIPPASITFLCARSGQGKTSFLLSAMCRWHAQGDRIYYAGLESRPQTLRIQWAARVIGADPGDIISGAFLAWPNAAEISQKMRAELQRQESDPEFHRVRFSPHERVDEKAMAAICAEAHDFGAEWVVVDHIDHIKAGGRGPYEESRRVADLALEMAHRFDLRLLIASQINREGLSQDPFRNHKPVREEHVKMGDHKLEMADYMFGIYRPLDPNKDSDAERAVKEGRASIDSVLAKNTMAINVMKHRPYGSRTGSKVLLGFHRGEVVDDLAATADTHGIGTARRSLA